MSKSFFEISRLEHVYRPVGERVQDFDEVEARLPQGEIAELSRRCQNCGIPFCHAMGCPLHNDVPDMIRAVVMGDWKGAWERLSETSSFPEFTSRVCPALCEASCCLEGTGYGATNIRQIEKRIIDTAFERDWVKPLVPVERRPESVAVIGAGPAGLAAAAKLNEAGYQVVVYDRQERPGGLLRYGIPCFKLDKALIDRRWQLLEAAGVQFRGQAAIGRDIAGEYLLRQHDAVIVACGTPVARDLSKVPGRDLAGIHLALEYLGGQNRALTGETPSNPICAKGKRVLVIGGGDTGSDCAGTAFRQGARSVVSIELMPKPPCERDASTPWPMWPYKLRTSSSIEEGVRRYWNLNTLRFLGEDGHLTGVEVTPVEWKIAPNGRPESFKAVGTPQTIECDLAFLALGFLKQTREQTLASLGLPDEESIVLAGDVANGPSLVVRAMADGRAAAHRVRSLLER